MNFLGGVFLLILTISTQTLCCPSSDNRKAGVMPSIEAEDEFHYPMAAASIVDVWPRIGLTVLPILLNLLLRM
ncbi:unnamed protein product [Rodentolepis nana]|uniref:Secreted protein n=1 Tax=Rodentolepis nana TaxID=102285 RepID=A0A0R3T744_RODNA|nr:unnamed protein product [Rodentolepis nana]